MKRGYELNLIVLSMLPLFIFKFLKIKSFSLVFSNLLIEFFIFLFGYFLFIWLFNHIENHHKKIAKVFFYIFFVISLFSFLLSSFYFNDSLNMKYNVANLSSGVISFFITEILTLKVLLLIMLSFVFVFLLANLFTIKERIFKHFLSYFLIISFFAIYIFSFNSVSLSNIYLNPLMNLENLGRVDINYSDSYEFDLSDYDKEFDGYDLEINDKKIFVFVMEQTNFRDFMSVKENSFIEKVKNDSIIFSNYYTQNQDSRTAIWSMFSSEFIPYESYIGEWQKKYGSVIYNNNLIDFFKSKDYSTCAVSSVTDINLILGAYVWSDLIFLKEFDEDNPDYLCFHDFESQKGCEDRILIPQIRDFIKSNLDENYFFYQELIFGHGEDYLVQSGLSRPEYYNNYFNEVYEILNEFEILNDSLIIITSDHGDKGYFSKEPYHYNIPLILIDSDFNQREVKELYSHLSFKDILLSVLSNQSLPNPEKEVFLIGQTLSNEIGYLNYDFSFNGIINNEDFTIKYYEGFKDVETINFIFNKLNQLRVDMESKNKDRDNYCVNCDINKRNLRIQNGYN